MFRALATASAALALSAVAHAGNDARTTRVIPADVYGATVTVEEGVRVFRPLPSDRHVIVNPSGDTDIEVKVHEYDAPRRGIRR